MKAIVFDNSGTLIERYRALKNLETGLIFDNVSSLDIVDDSTARALVVIQTDPSKCIINARPDQRICHFIKRNDINIDISYSTKEIKKRELIDAITGDESKVSDIQDTIRAVMDKRYDIQICSGSGFIVDLDTGKIEFTVTSGGRVFPEVRDVVKELQKRDINIFVASGDRKGSLKALARYIGIP